MRAFDAVVKYFRDNNITFKTTDICKVVAKTPAPCFYVSTEQALFQYWLYKNGKSDIRNEVRRKMYAEIFVRFEDLMKRSGGSMYLYAAMEVILSQTAPCFYLNDSSAISFYYRAMEKKKEKSKKRA